jgi:hypothetical protein
MMAGTAPNYDNVQWPGADTIRIPVEVFGTAGAGNPGGVMALNKEVDFDVNKVNTARGVSNVVTLLPAECQASLISFNNTTANNINFALPAVFPGQPFILENKGNNSITFLVTGKTGVTLANNNTQAVICSSLKGDILASGAAIAGS